MRESFDKLPYSSCGQEKGRTSGRQFQAQCSEQLTAGGHLQEGDGSGLLLQQVRVRVGPAQGQDQRPPLGVERVLKLLLLGAGRTRRVVGSHAG